jgi:hypothetical protein
VTGWHPLHTCDERCVFGCSHMATKARALFLPFRNLAVHPLGQHCGPSQLSKNHRICLSRVAGEFTYRSCASSAARLPRQRHRR